MEDKQVPSRFDEPVEKDEDGTPVVYVDPHEKGAAEVLYRALFPERFRDADFEGE